MLDSEETKDLTAVREHTLEVIMSASGSDRPVLVEAPPSSGKTTSAFKLATAIDTPITYLSARTDLYEQAAEWFEEQEGVTWEIIPSPHRDCPTFQGNNDGNKYLVQRLYNKGYSGRKIHYLSKDIAYTPCAASGCPYLEKLERIDGDVDSVDVLIGHHSHSHREWYVKDRIVILDEFNADPFITKFPNAESTTNDDPSQLIPEFLKALSDNDQDFPVDSFKDITDIIENRSKQSCQQDAVNWFLSNGASRKDAEELDFLNPTTYQHDQTHFLAPFLTFSLLCMDRVGPSIELAPHPEGDYIEEWKEAGLNPSERCLRNRNSGEMYAFQPPDLSSSKQVIGLDGTPTRELWNLFLPPGTEFDHRKVVARDDFVTYLNSALNMSIVQIGGGMHNYAGGRISKFDKYRFAAVHRRENKRFPLISTKKALEEYDDRGWLSSYVKQAPRASNSTKQDDTAFPDYRVRHYSTIKSSNEFKKESVGVVAGTPHPGDDVVEIWAGLQGQAVTPQNKGENKTFGEFGDKIFQHFAHNQVVQAVLRFGRDKSVWDNEGVTVYVSSSALPKWFDVNKEINIRSNEKEDMIIKELMDISQSADRDALAFRTAGSIHKKLEKSSELKTISENYIRDTLNQFSSKNIVTVRENTGKGGSDIFRWNKNNTIIESNEDEYILLSDNSIYVEYDLS